MRDSLTDHPGSHPGSRVVVLAEVRNGLVAVPGEAHIAPVSLVRLKMMVAAPEEDRRRRSQEEGLSVVRRCSSLDILDSCPFLMNA